MKGFVVAEEGHVVNILPPRNIKAAKNSDVVLMENYEHATIIVQRGATMGGTVVLQVEECDDVTPTTAAAILFDYYEEASPYGTGDQPAARTTVAATTGLTLAASINAHTIIELDASALSAGYPGFRIALSAAGAVAIGSAVAILSGARYQSKSPTPTAIS